MPLTVDLADLPEEGKDHGIFRGFSLKEAVEFHDPQKPEVPYSDLGFSFQEPHFHEAFKRSLEKYIGDCWKLPNDKRLPLNFSNSLIDWTHAA